MADTVIQRVNVIQCECNQVDCDEVFDYYTDKGKYIIVADLEKRLNQLELAKNTIEELRKFFNL